MMPEATYGPTLERWLQRLANAGRSSRTLAAYRSDLDDTMTTVAVNKGLLSPTTADEAQRLEAFDALDLATVTFDDLDEAIAEFRTRPDPRFRTNPHRAPDERAPATVAQAGRRHPDVLRLVLHDRPHPRRPVGQARGAPPSQAHAEGAHRGDGHLRPRPVRPGIAVARA